MPSRTGDNQLSLGRDALCPFYVKTGLPLDAWLKLTNICVYIFIIDYHEQQMPCNMATDCSPSFSPCYGLMCYTNMNSLTVNTRRIASNWDRWGYLYLRANFTKDSNIRGWNMVANCAGVVPLHPWGSNLQRAEPGWGQCRHPPDIVCHESHKVDACIFSSSGNVLCKHFQHNRSSFFPSDQAQLNKNRHDLNKNTEAIVMGAFLNNIKTKHYNGGTSPTVNWFLFYFSWHHTHYNCRCVNKYLNAH